MDAKERKRRLMEKAMRKPINDVVLDVQKGFIDVKDLFAHIDTKLKIKKEKKDG